MVTSTTSACDNEKSLGILKDYIWLTEDYPPYNFYDDDGHLVGMSVEILELVYQELNLPLNRDDIRLIPWARLVKNLKMSNKYAAFTMVSTPTRNRAYTLVPTFLPTNELNSIFIGLDRSFRLQPIFSPIQYLNNHHILHLQIQIFSFQYKFRKIKVQLQVINQAMDIISNLIFHQLA